MSTFISNLIPGSPFLSYVAFFGLMVTALYFARGPAHGVIRAAATLVRDAMRLAAHSAMLGEKRLVQRNREVLLAAGQAEVEREIEREFQRIESMVERDLQNHPTLYRAVSEQITRIEEDFNQTGNVPPTPPAWASAIKAVAKIPDQDNTLVASILTDIHKTLVVQEKRATEEYRRGTAQRHEILGRMIPYWRQVAKKLDQVGKAMPEVLSRARTIDGLMSRYEEIREGTDRAARKLSSSSKTQFLSAGIVLLIAVGGAMINFNLIALPMSEMVGGASYIGHYKTSDVAALVIILVETAMGLFLMESLRITRLFPLIGSLDDKLRLRMLWISFSILLILAGVESSLAFMRDRIAADMQALRQSLAGTDAVANTASIIPTVGQMVMGFILPFALTFVAIPLESFIHASRTVVGVVLVTLIRLLAFSLRFIGTTAHYLGSVGVGLYDLFIFPPLWIEGAVKARISRTEGESARGEKPTASSQTYGEADARPHPYAARPMPHGEEVISE